MPTLGQLLDTLQRDGHIDDPTADEVREQAALLGHHPLALSTPRLLRVISGAAAWLASGFFAVGVTELLLVQRGVWLVLGALMIGAAVCLRKLETRSGQDALTGAALALAMTGIGVIEGELLALGFGSTKLWGTLTWVSLFVLGLYSDPTGRFLAAMGVIGGTLGTLAAVLDSNALDYCLPALVVAGWGVHLARLPAHLGPAHHLHGPVASALTVSALLLAARTCVDPAPQYVALAVHNTLLFGTLGLLLRLLEPHRLTLGTPTLLAALLGTTVLGLSTWTSPGVLISLSFAMIGVHQRDRLLTGTALVGLVGYGLWAYYALSWPFQLKALAMIGSGACLIALRMALRAQEPT
jgi:hypothetical protein